LGKRFYHFSFQIAGDTYVRKLSRRDAIKVLAAGGAALAVVPPIVARAYTPTSDQRNLQQAEDKNEAVGLQTGLSGEDAPLVVVVRGNEIVGYSGEEEIRLVNPSLSSQLHGAFRSVRS
jgi:hypothetical protein